MSKIKNYQNDAPLSLRAKRTVMHYAGFLVRGIIAPVYSKMVEDPKFKDGISANVLTKDDVWLREALCSIKDYVDEFIIIDSSNETYYNRNLSLIKELKLKNVKHIRKELDIYRARVLSHSLSEYHWILHWDGDMVAFDSGKNNILNLMNMIRKLSSKHSYYEIFFPLVITGSRIDRASIQGYQVEAWLYTNSPRFTWVLKKLGKGGEASIERAKFPLFYKKIYLETPYALHLKFLFPLDKLVLKQVQYKWMNPEIRKRYVDFDQFMRYHRSKLRVYDLIKDSGDLDEQRYGKIPAILEQFKGLELPELLTLKSKLDKIDMK